MSYKSNCIRELENEEAAEYLIEHIAGESNVCKFFGCGRELSLMESLYGDYCPFHQEEKTTVQIVDKVLQW